MAAGLMVSAGVVVLASGMTTGATASQPQAGVKASIATKAVAGYDGNLDLAPPTSDSSQRITAQQAADAAGGSPHPVAGGGPARAVLVHLNISTQGIDTDSWLVFTDGGCVPVHGPMRQLAEGHEDPFTTAPSCAEEPLITAVDALSGKVLLSFAGGDTPDPSTLLAPTPTRAD